MTVHYKGKCIPCVNVKCNVPIETKRNKQQPLLVMQGFSESVDIDGDTCIIN